MKSRLKDYANSAGTRAFVTLGYSKARTADAKREAWWWAVARGSALRRRRRLLRGWAIVWTDIGRAELLPVDVPTAGPGELTIEILVSAVSAGTERAQYLRLPSARVDYPYIPGYSAAGRVLSAGSDARSLPVGTLVAVRGALHASVVTCPSESVHALADGVALEDASFVQLGVICRQGIRRGELEGGERVVVIGAGPIGTITQRLVRATAATVVVVARSRAKEDVALRGGVDSFLTADDPEAASLAADVVFDTTGDPQALSLAVDAAAPGARIVLLGSPRGVSRDIPLASIREKRLRVVGAHVETTRREHPELRDPHRADAESFLAALASGSSLADIVELRADPREADLFYRSLARRRDVVGALFDWSLVGEADRAGNARMLRIPDVSGSGIEAGARPVSVRRSSRRQFSWEPRDPFEDASGDLRIGLVGCGDIGVHNAAGVALAPNARLTACHDPVTSLAEELGKRHGASIVGSVEEMLDRADVDAVFLAVPHDLHAPLAVQVAESGKHVIVEKPLANNLRAGAEIVEAARRHGVVASVAFPHRYEPHAMAGRRLVKAGAVGQVSATLVKYFADKPPSYWLGGFSGRSISDWRGSRERAGGGVLIMNVCHLLDLVRFVSGLEVEVCTASTTVLDGVAEVEDTVSLTLEYENGAVGSLFASSALRGNRSGSNELHIWGEHGSLQLEPKPHLYTLRALDGLRAARWNELAGFPGREIRAAFVSRLATAIARDEQPDIPASDGLAVQALIEAAYRSSEERAPVRPKDLLQALPA